MAVGQPTVTVSGGAIVGAIQAWCDRRLLNRSRVLGIAFMVYGRLDSKSYPKIIEAHKKWQDAGCPIGWLDEDSDELPRFSLDPVGPPDGAGDAAGDDVSSASDAAGARSKPRRRRQSN